MYTADLIDTKLRGQTSSGNLFGLLFGLSLALFVWGSLGYWIFSFFAYAFFDAPGRGVGFIGAGLAWIVAYWIGRRLRFSLRHRDRSIEEVSLDFFAGSLYGGVQELLGLLGRDIPELATPVATLIANCARPISSAEIQSGLEEAGLATNKKDLLLALEFLVRQKWILGNSTAYSLNRKKIS